MATPKEQHDARAHAITTGADQSPTSLPPGAAHAGGTFREPDPEGDTRRDGVSGSTPADPSVPSSDEP